jgi:hypothetical protein
LRWAWPLAVRCAHDLGDTAGATASFTAAIASLREQSTPYHLAHGLLDHAEYLAATAASTEVATATAGTKAAPGIGAIADIGATSGIGAAALAIAEVRDIACRLRCQPLLNRADALTLQTPRDPATTAPPDSSRVAR